MLMNWLRKAPTPLLIAIVVTLAVATIAYLAGFVYLTSIGKDVTEYRALLNTAFNYVGLLLGGTATIASVSAARSASNAEDAGNGKLTERDAEIERLRSLLNDRGTP
jgi:hypothetical protein